MESKFVHKQEPNRMLRTRSIGRVRQLKKIIDNRAGMLRQCQMLVQFRAAAASAAPTGVKSAFLSKHAKKHAGDSKTVAALSGCGLNFTNTPANKAAILAFIHAHPTKDNGNYHNILLDGASNTAPTSANPSQWLGYVVNPDSSVTVKHIGPFGESPTGVAAQL